MTKERFKVKARKTWGELNPVTRVVPMKAKRPKRFNYKSFAKMESAEGIWYAEVIYGKSI
jgi:hypothetical protein